MHQSTAHRPARGDASAQPGGAWIELDVETAATTLDEAWRSLVAGPGAPPMDDPLWQRVYWRAFGATQPPRVHALRIGEGVAGVIPLQPGGYVVRRWTSGFNAHVPYGTVALDASGRVARSALDHLMRSAQMLELGPLYVHDAATVALTQAARQRGYRVSLDASGADAILDLPSSWAELKKSLGANLVASTPRKIRQLQRLGRLEFAIVTGGAALEHVLDESFMLETLGWKGERGGPGAPIRASQETLQFYSDLATAAARAGRLALYTLRLDSRLIAFEYCLRGNGRIDLLKLSFHPDFGRYSPGNALRFLLLEHEIGAGQATTYHMGLVSEWKARWASRVEPLGRLRIYDRGIRGTAAYLLKSWIPGRSRQQPVVRRAGRWILSRLHGAWLLMSLLDAA